MSERLTRSRFFHFGSLIIQRRHETQQFLKCYSFVSGQFIHRIHSREDPPQPENNTQDTESVSHSDATVTWSSTKNEEKTAGNLLGLYTFGFLEIGARFVVYYIPYKFKGSFYYKDKLLQVHVYCILKIPFCDLVKHRMHTGLNIRYIKHDKMIKHMAFICKTYTHSLLG